MIIMCIRVVVAAAAVTRTTMVVEGFSAGFALLRSSSGRSLRRSSCLSIRPFTIHYPTCWKSGTTMISKRIHRIHSESYYRSTLAAAASTTAATSPPPPASATNELVSKSSLPAAAAAAAEYQKNNSSTTVNGPFSVLSTANLVRIITSSSRHGGVASIRIRDESSTISTSTTTTNTASSSSSSNNTNTPNVLGKRVLFTLPADSPKVVEGIIIALRYPIAFVYIPTTSTSTQPDEHDDDTHEDLLLQQPIQKLQQLAETTKSESIANTTKVHILNSDTKLKVPSPKNTSTMTTNTANNNINSTIIDCFGNSLVPVESTPHEITTTHVFTPIPKVSEIALINTPLLTGITMVDALTPIGRGQNMLIVGEQSTGRKSIALSAMRTQISHPNNKGAQCIYASTTTSILQEEATTITNNNVLSRFQSYGIANQITFVSKRPSADTSVRNTQPQSQQPQQNNDITTIDAIIDAAESVAVASSACSIADYWARNYGYDTLVVIDTIDPYKIFWDYTTQALMDIYGQQAVNLNTNNNSQLKTGGGEMRGFFSELIQRAGRYNPSYGGGSVTLAIIATIPPDDGITFSSTTSTTSNDTPYLYQPTDFAHQPKIQSRIKALMQQNIKITSQVLKKLGIPTPPRCDKGWKRYDALCHVDDLISMTDGQIWLQPSIHRHHHSHNIDDERTRSFYQVPFMDIRQSMTRVGIGADTNSRADAPALQPLIGGLRFTLAQAAEEEEQVLDSKNLLQRQRDALLLAMYTKPNTVRTLAEECICLMAVKSLVTSPPSGGSSSTTTTTEKEELMDRLIDYVYHHVPSSIIQEINDTFELNPSSKELIQSSIESFFVSHYHQPK